MSKVIQVVAGAARKSGTTAYAHSQRWPSFSKFVTDFTAVVSTCLFYCKCENTHTLSSLQTPAHTHTHNVAVLWRKLAPDYMHCRCIFPRVLLFAGYPAQAAFFRKNEGPFSLRLGYIVSGYCTPHKHSVNLPAFSNRFVSSNVIRVTSVPNL